MKNKQSAPTLLNDNEGKNVTSRFGIMVAIIVAISIIATIVAVCLLGQGGPVAPIDLEPGLYKADSDYKVMTMSWAQLLEEKVVYVENGVVYTNADMSAQANASSDILNGTLVLPKDGSVTTLGDYIPHEQSGRAAFAFCENLISVLIPEGVEKIGAYAFYKCVELTNVSVADSVASVGDSAFRSCAKLSNVGKLGSINAIPMYAFADSGIVTVGIEGSGASVEIPGTTTDIGINAFASCNSLTTVEVPNGVKIIGDAAFTTCANLSKITIPASVISIGSQAFAVCTSLTSVGPIGSGSSVELSNGITALGDFVFAYCSGIKTVIIPEQVVSIGKGVFKACESLEAVSLHEWIVSIGEVVFRDCKKLDHVNFNGTQEQWSAIAQNNWNGKSSILRVECADGTINLS